MMWIDAPGVVQQIVFATISLISAIGLLISIFVTTDLMVHIAMTGFIIRIWTEDLSLIILPVIVKAVTINVLWPLKFKLGRTLVILNEIQQREIVPAGLPKLVAQEDCQ